MGTSQLFALTALFHSVVGLDTIMVKNGSGRGYGQQLVAVETQGQFSIDHFLRNTVVPNARTWQTVPNEGITVNGMTHHPERPYTVEIMDIGNNDRRFYRQFHVRVTNQSTNQRATFPLRPISRARANDHAEHWVKIDEWRQ